jgi:hypothetical protein
VEGRVVVVVMVAAAVVVVVRVWAELTRQVVVVDVEWLEAK